MNCLNIRKINVKIHRPDGSISTVEYYFDIVENKEVVLTDAQLCPDIVTLDVSCASVC